MEKKLQEIIKKHCQLSSRTVINRAAKEITDLFEQKLTELEQYNPYPESVFKPVKSSTLTKIVKLLKDNGYSPDALFGHWGREVWDNCSEKAREIFEDEK